MQSFSESNQSGALQASFTQETDERCNVIHREQLRPFKIIQERDSLLGYFFEAEKYRALLQHSSAQGRSDPSQTTSQPSSPVATLVYDPAPSRVATPRRTIARQHLLAVMNATDLTLQDLEADSSNTDFVNPLPPFSGGPNPF